jgi:carbamate kinase
VSTVLALGGHLLAGGALDEVRQALEALGGDAIVVTHGNGPQVGDELARSPDVPIHVAVARTQAEIGSALAVALGTVCVVTHVAVDPDDAGFERPTKPIGPWLSEDPGGDTIHDRERGWRRVVASPEPLEILELPAIAALADRSVTVVCCGGGGIPVAGGEGVDAVIDKDLASALLGQGLGAQRLVVLTDVDAVYRGFRTPDAAPIEQLTVVEAETLLPDLPAGSMGPKLRACVRFVRATGGEALITSPDGLARGGGTRVVS